MALGGRIEIDVVPNLDGFDSKLRDGLQGTSSAAEQAGTIIGVALAAGTAIAAVGFKQAIDLGIEFQANLNSLQAVTRATDQQMSAVGATATRLGSDLTLPATSAADAAEAMLELAKGGLSVEQAMAAAKGTLQLAAAAQITGAEAASIQSAALNSFGLEAGDAGRVADVLANSANAASGEITEFADAMQQVGAVANQFGISIEDTSTALSLFANAGIRGSDAGTLLKSALLALANPSKPAQKAMETLGLSAFDASGNFVGLESIIGQLRDASGNLTPELYAQAAAQVFGSDAARLAGIAAGTTAESWDVMSAAVSKAGGAQEVAAAKTKGLGGAIEGLNSQLETAQLKVFDAISGPLEQAVRAATELVPRIGDGIASGLRVIVAVGETVGPQLASGIAGGGGAVLAAGRALVEPFVNAVGTALVGAFQVAIDVGTSYVGILGNIVAAVTPVAVGIGAVATAATASDGALSAIGATFVVVGNAAEALSFVLVPIGALVGGLVSGFAALPGPIQSVVLAMLALRFAGPLLAGLGTAFNNARTSGTLFGNTLNAVTAPARALAAGVTTAAGAFRQFGGEMRVQQGLAASAGQSIGRLGAAQAAFQTSTLGAVAAARGFSQQVSALRAAATATGQPISAVAASMSALGQRVPLITQMGAAFSSASASVGRFGAAAGVAAAAATGLRGIGTGLIGALGGPFGAAITAAVIGLGLLGAANRKAAADEQAHTATVGSLTDALKSSSGVFNQNAREVLAGTDVFKAAAAGAQQFGIGLGDLSNAAINGGASLEAIRGKLTEVALANSNLDVNADGSISRGYNEVGLAALASLGQVDALVGVVQQSRTSYAEFAQAVDEAGGSMVNGAASGSSLQGAMQVLGDAAATAEEKTRALNDALNELSGGQLSLEQAQAALNETISEIGTSFDAAKAAADGAGVGFLNATGGINTTTEAGRALLDSTAELGQRMTETAQAAFDANGGFGNLAVSTAAARDAAQSSYDAFIQAAQGIGLTAEQAAGLAARYGLIPDTVVTLIASQGATQVEQELLGVKQAFDQVPGEKRIIVQSLTDEAKGQLASLGIIVNELPDGTIEIFAPTEAAKANLNNFVSEIGGTTATFTLDANPAPANNQVNGSVTFANGQVGTITIDGNQAPVNGKIVGSVQLADGSVGTVTIDGNPDPATGQIRAVVDLGNGTPTTITINPRDLTSPVIQKLQRSTSSTHTINVRQVGSTALLGQAVGGIVEPMAHGGLVGFARGGYGTYRGHKLTPMATGLAAMVQPNTWRVVGDRMRDPEAYIPINRSRRSMALLEETARRMGRYMQPIRTYADGGVAERSARSLASLRFLGNDVSDNGPLIAELRALGAAARLTDGDVELIHELRSQTRTLTSVLREAGRSTSAATARGLRTAAEGGF